MKYIIKHTHVNGIIVFDITKVLIKSNFHNSAIEIRES